MGGRRGMVKGGGGEREGRNESDEVEGKEQRRDINLCERGGWGRGERRDGGRGEREMRLRERYRGKELQFVCWLLA